jgi:hypothetical protein
MGKLLFFFPVGIPTADAGAIPGMKQDVNHPRLLAVLMGLDARRLAK